MPPARSARREWPHVRWSSPHHRRVRVSGEAWIAPGEVPSSPMEAAGSVPESPVDSGLRGSRLHARGGDSSTGGEVIRGYGRAYELWITSGYGCRPYDDHAEHLVFRDAGGAVDHGESGWVAQRRAVVV